MSHDGQSPSDSLKPLVRRAVYLTVQIAQRRCSPKSMNYLCSELRALNWAIPQLAEQHKVNLPNLYEKAKAKEGIE
jgi:hypothetical protein